MYTSSSPAFCICSVTILIAQVAIAGCLAVNLPNLFRKIYRSRGFPFREDPDFGSKPILEEYDFIVVGSGPAGSVVANRLSENRKWKVLLLEAGEDEPIFSQMTPIAHYLQFTIFNWNYDTERQPNACLGLRNKSCPWPAGRGTGGSSLINGNIYTRGNRRDFDGWAKAGNPGWSYDDLLPYFKKSESVNIGPLKRSPFHGTDGPLPVEYPPYRTKLADAFLKSAPEAGFKLIDYNNPDTHVGFSQVQGTMRAGKRVSAYKAFIKPLKDRRNLHVAIKSRVTKILIGEKDKAAYAVQFVKQRKKRVVRARKEIILSAGAFNSPQLLMLSGIGPREHLDKVGIRTIQDLRVGDNLQEHPSYANLAFLVNDTIGLISKRLVAESFANVLEWIEGEGVLTILPSEGLGYARTKYAKDEEPPDVEFIFVPCSLAGEGGTAASILRKTMGIPDRTFNEVYRDVVDKDAWSIWVMLMYPESRGTVRLRSSNPLHAPLLQSNFFDRDIDLNRIVEGIKMVLNLSKTDAFQAIGSALHRKPIPACKQLPFGSDQYWACCVKQLTMQMHHQCGTCKMGPESDQSAVVSPRLKVHGVKNLRVIDASIMPTIPGAHTVAAAYMVGEKGADLVKEDWEKKD